MNDKVDPTVTYEFRIKEIQRYSLTMYTESKKSSGGFRIGELPAISAGCSQIGEFQSFKQADAIASAMAKENGGFYSGELYVPLQFKAGSLSEVDNTGFSYGQKRTNMSTIHRKEIQELKQLYASVIDRLNMMAHNARTNIVAKEFEFSIEEAAMACKRAVRLIEQST